MSGRRSASGPAEAVRAGGRAPAEGSWRVGRRGGRWPAGTAVAEVLIEARRAGFVVQPTVEEPLQWVDTVDHRLARQGLVLVIDGGRLVLQEERGLVGRVRWPRRAGEVGQAPLRASLLARGRVRQRLEAEVGEAELRPVLTLVRQIVPLHTADDTRRAELRGRAELRVLRAHLPAAPDPLGIDLLGAWRPGLAPVTPADVVAARQPLGFGRGPVPLDPAAPGAEAVRRVLRPLVGRLLAEEAGARAGEPEALHDWRVALRSLRALLTLLGDTLPARPVRRLRRRLRALQQQTGRMRDLDVLHERLSALGAPGLDDLSWAQLSAWLEAQRRDERARVQATLDSPRHERVKARLDRLVEGAKVGARGTTPIGLLTRLRLHEAWGELILGGRAIDDGSPAEALHDLRKVGKRLRYLVELLGGLLPEAPARTLVKRLKGLQDVLGRFQDEEVHQELLADVEGAERWVAEIAQEHERTRAAFGAEFRAFDAEDVEGLVRALIRV